MNNVNVLLLSRVSNAVMSTNSVNRTFVRTFFKKFFKNKFPFIKTGGFGSYEIVRLGTVSPARPIPTHIPKPEYADSGIPRAPPKEPELKDKNQIECMIHSCVLAKRILKEIRPYIRPGVTTDLLDWRIHEMIIDNGAYPSPLNYLGFPKSICTSVNNVACHGVPDDRPLKDGDIMNIDVTVFLNGYHGDCSEMFEVGNVDEEGKRLIEVTSTCLDKAISICKPNEKISSIGKIVEETAEKNGYTVLPAFGGHGIGSYFHGPPDIYHYANAHEGVMKPGMTFTIEPVLTQGKEDVVVLEDGWTCITLDNARTAQVEHTILITDNGCDILTRPYN